MNAELSRRRVLALGAGAASAVWLSHSLAAHAALQEVPAGALRFVPVTPTRVASTVGADGSGTGWGYVRVDGSTIRVAVAGEGSIPADARAVVANLTVSASADVDVTAYPAGTARPLASNLNIDLGGKAETDQANMITVQLDGGAMDVYV
ncbi:MAG TPA: hypothetical protein PLV68_07050, partial [Ilumatobacteraceae bacterium]|nr:hypothetical protein [Ilumatobacteraceae bacterium]